MHHPRCGRVHLQNGQKPLADFPEIVKAWEKGEILLKEAARRYNMGETSFYRRLREYRLQLPKKK